jgi:hypothetical protein
MNTPQPAIFGVAPVHRNAAIRRMTEGIQAGKNSVPPAVRTPSIGCLLCQKTPNKRRQSGVYGWVKCKAGGKKEFYIHHLALLAAGRDEELHKVFEDSQQVSHRCHRSRCFEAKHLIVESGEDNRDRNECRGKDNTHKCPHHPPCILPPPAQE